MIALVVIAILGAIIGYFVNASAFAFSSLHVPALELALPLTTLPLPPLCPCAPADKNGK